MSLINDMLQELDARGAPNALPKSSQVKAIAPAARNAKRLILMLGIVLLAVLLAGLALLWYRQHSAQSAPMVTSASKLAAGSSAASVAQAVENEARAAQARASASSKNAPAAGEGAANSEAVLVGSLKIDSSLSNVPSLASPPARVAEAPMPAPTPTPTPAQKTALKVDNKLAQESLASNPSKLASAANSAPSKMHIAQASNSPQQRAENEYRKANQLVQQGRQLEALLTLEQALLQDPLHHAARQSLVGVLINLNRPDEAIKRLQQGLQQDPSHTLFASLLARLQAERGDVHAAIDTMYSSLPMAGGQAEFQALLAGLLQRDKRHKVAAEHYQAALKIQPENGVWWMGLGISLQAENRQAASMEAFLKAKNSNNLTPQLLAFVEQKLAQLQAQMK